MGGRFHHFNSNIGAKFKILGEPDSREVSPTKFLDENIPVDENFANVARMIPPDLIILNPLILTMILIIQISNPLP